MIYIKLFYSWLFCTFVVFFFLPVFLNVRNIESGYVVLFSFLCGLSVIVLDYMGNVRKRKREFIERICGHGVLGAAFDREKCIDCKKEYDDAKILEKEKNEEVEKKVVLDRQIAFESLIAKARMPEYLRQMNPYEFEKLVCNLFRQLGYSAECTSGSGDGGIDGYLRKDNYIGILQCKRVKGSVGQPVLRDLFGVMSAENANEGFVVTTGKVSRQAREWSEGKNIRIIELGELVSMIREHFPEGIVIPENFKINNYSTEKVGVCPECGRSLRRRNGRYRAFMGCSGYPKCRYTISIRR